jgi:hypothetical protein
VKRTTVALTLAVLMLFGAAACGGDENADDTTELQSDGDQSSSSDDTSNDTSSSDDSSGSNDSSSDDSTSSDDTPNLDDLGDLGDLDMGALGDCMAIGMTYAGLALGALGGGDEAAQEALDAIDELETQLPSELEDDIAVIADAYATMAEEGIMEGGEALDTDEFKEADANIQAYIDETCGS